MLDVDDAAEMASTAVPYDEWHQAFQKWLSRHQSKNPCMDDICRLFRFWHVIEEDASVFSLVC